MTVGGMKARAHRIDSRLWLGLLIAATGMVNGCSTVDPFNRDIDPNSPAAQRVAELARTNDTYPRWEDFPAAPQNVPTAEDIRNRVLGLEAAELQLNREVAAIDWTLDDDDGDPWARDTRNRIDQRLARPVDPNAMAEALAWAERVRARSNPPPPLNY